MVELDTRSAPGLSVCRRQQNPFLRMTRPDRGMSRYRANSAERKNVEAILWFANGLSSAGFPFKAYRSFVTDHGYDMPLRLGFET